VPWSAVRRRRPRAGRPRRLNRLLAVDGIDGVLLDIDGVLVVSWDQIPGAAETVGWLRAQGMPFRLITNTTTHSRHGLASVLRDAGIDVEGEDVVTAVVMTGSYLRSHHPGAKVFLLSDGDPTDDLPGVELVEDGADVVVIGGAGTDFSYERLNRAFGMLMAGAVLVGMHRNMYWRTKKGLQLDGGAFIAGLEEATGRKAVVCGKPSPTFFHEAVGMVGTPPERTAMVGDDIVNDVLGAQAAGLVGVLVRTGKFMPTDLERGSHRPDRVIDSIADLPGLLRPS
jgi:HAD superfamily hydrolase (TIGR01458 family)